MIGIVRRYKVKVSSTYKFSCFQGVGDSIVCTPPSTHLCSLRFKGLRPKIMLIKSFITKILGSVSPGSAVCEPYLTLTLDPI